MNNIVDKCKDLYLEEIISNAEYYANSTLKRNTMNTLAEGYPGYSILLYNLFQYTNDDKWKYINHEMIKANNTTVDISDNLISLWTGPTSFSSSLYLWSSEISIYDNSLKEINNKIFEQIHYKIDEIEKRTSTSNINCTDYDLIYGLSGIVRYLILFKEENRAIILAERAIRFMLNLLKRPNKLKLVNSLNLYTKIYREGYIDTGVSHGCLGIISILSICVNQNLFEDNIALKNEVIGTIKSSVNKLLLFKKHTKSFWYLPNYIDYNNYKNGTVDTRHNLPLSYMWCYGLTGMTRSLILFADATGDKVFKRKIINNYSNALDYFIKLDSIHKSNPTFCHGIAGILYESNLIYLDTKDERFNNHNLSFLRLINKYKDKNLRYPFYDKSVSEHDVNKAGLLNGSIGVYLVLLSIIGDKPFEGDFIFLKR